MTRVLWLAVWLSLALLVSAPSLRAQPNAVITNAADFDPINHIAGNQYGTIFGSNLAPGVTNPPALALNVNGTTVAFRYQNVRVLMLVGFVSPGQINCVGPDYVDGLPRVPSFEGSIEIAHNGTVTAIIPRVILRYRLPRAFLTPLNERDFENQTVRVPAATIYLYHPTTGAFLGTEALFRVEGGVLVRNSIRARFVTEADGTQTRVVQHMAAFVTGIRNVRPPDAPPDRFPSVLVTGSPDVRLPLQYAGPTGDAGVDQINVQLTDETGRVLVEPGRFFSYFSLGEFGGTSNAFYLIFE